MPTILLAKHHDIYILQYIANESKNLLSKIYIRLLWHHWCIIFARRVAVAQQYHISENKEKEYNDHWDQHQIQINSDPLRFTHSHADSRRLAQIYLDWLNAIWISLNSQEGKGKSPWGKREKGSGATTIWAPFSLGIQTARTHARTKRNDFPVDSLPQPPI